MVTGKDKQLIYEKIREYVKTLEKNKVPVWRLYLYGSYSKNTFHPDSDIDLAVFWDRDDIDGLDEDIRLRMLRWDIDLRIEAKIPWLRDMTCHESTFQYFEELFADVPYESIIAPLAVSNHETLQKVFNAYRKKLPSVAVDFKKTEVKHFESLNWLQRYYVLAGKETAA